MHHRCTTTLFAAMNTLDGTVISRCEQRHRHCEWLDFLRQINREMPQDKSLHLICDNYATHKHPKVKEWLAKHPRFFVDQERRERMSQNGLFC